MNKFRPQDISKRYTMRLRRVYGRSESYNWQTRIVWHPAGWKTNQISIGRRFGHLHYLACHAPAPIQKKWRPAYNNFYKKHFGSSSSMRYSNTHTCHAWL